MRIGRRNWALAMMAAMLIHFGIAAAILWQSPLPGAKQAGLARLEISLGPAGGALVPKAARIPEVESATVVGAAEPIEAFHRTEVAKLQAPEQTVEPVVPAGVQPAEPIEITKAAPHDEVIPLAEPDKLEMPIEIWHPLELAKLEPQKQPIYLLKPARVEAKETKAVLPRARPAPVAKITTTPTANTKAAPNEKTEPASQAVSVRSAEFSRTEPAVGTAAARPAAGGMSGPGSAVEAASADLPGARADYLTYLQAWLERHKVYPRRARLRREEGTALLFFAIDREGRLLEHRLEKSTGYRLLDSEVEEMLRRAEPLPRMPDDMRHSRLELVVPVRFFLR